MLYRFEEYRLDTDTRTLARHGKPVALTPKIYMTLLVLLENHARVMTKEELCDRIWPGQFMEEANLAQNISTLRRLLKDVVSGQRYIATFHGVGIVFWPRSSARGQELPQTLRHSHRLRCYPLVNRQLFLSEK
jgi:DNA-binding winged helix-turn-helix (wHTH) protein